MLIRPRTRQVILGRAAMVFGETMPDATNTGVLQPWEAGYVARTPVAGNVTLSSPGQLYENKELTSGRLSVTAANVTVRNVLVTGGATPASGVVNVGNAAVSNVLFEDCEIRTDVPHYTWNTIFGHDTTFRRCNIWGGTDLAQISNGSISGPYSTGMVFEGCWMHDYRWWTAATGGVVHPSDTETHNDVIQQFGGAGTVIRGCVLDARYSKQNGHWVVTDPNNEPYTTVALHSLPDGGPYQTIPDTGSGTEATGRYSTDDASCIMINTSSAGLGSAPSTDFVVDRNWFIGGNYAVNGGGNAYPGGGENLGVWTGNRFSRDQGTQGGGGDATYTLAFLAGWAGHVTAPTTGPTKNYYYVAPNIGNAITVRT